MTTLKLNIWVITVIYILAIASSFYWNMWYGIVVSVISGISYGMIWHYGNKAKKYYAEHKDEIEANRK